MLAGVSAVRAGRFEPARESLMYQRVSSTIPKECVTMRKFILACGVLGLTGGLATSPTLADESAGMSGEQLFEFHGCVNCHGAKGGEPVSKLVPALAGKPSDELYDKASKILSGETSSEEAKLMHAAVYSPASCNAPPTDAQVQTITSWLATQ
jgi:mono/diheme cytochrome c family protein